MQNSPTDNLIFLKDAPMFWRSPSFVKTAGAFGHVSIEIYYSLMFGNEIPPTRKKTVLSRGRIKRTEDAYDYFVGILCFSGVVSNYSFPPTGTNTIDPVALQSGIIRNVTYISKEMYDMPWDEYKSTVPANLLDSLAALGGEI